MSRAAPAGNRRHARRLTARPAFRRMRTMRAHLLRGMACLTLCGWLLSAGTSQLVWLHVAAEHVGHGGDERPHGRIATPPHDSGHGVQEHHHFTSLRAPLLPTPRPHAPAPMLAGAPFVWTSPVLLRTAPVAPIPPPRGSPLRHTILLI